MRTFARWVVAGLAALAFVAPLKFTTPVVMQSLVALPGAGEWLALTWPNQLGVMFAFAAFVWLVIDPDRMQTRVDWLFVLPLILVLAQLPALTRSIYPHVSADTLMHLATCALLFYAAAWYARDGADATRIFGALALAAMVTCLIALKQSAGGLQETREFAANLPVSDELRARMQSNRVFGTFVYPNTLAGFLVVAFAPAMAWLWVRGRTWVPAVKWLALAFAGGLMLVTLGLTGSRGGFVAFAVMVVTWLWCLSRRAGVRAAIVAGAMALALVAGMVGLGKRGTSSLEARLDYWRGAVAIARDFPAFGTGPGTFGSIYPKYKTADTEEAQLVHNNYLQMWSDAGVAAFVVFLALWAVALRDGYRLTKERAGDAAVIAIVPALAGWVVHGLVDFDLYVPGIAYPVFALLGTLQGLKEVPHPDVVTERGRSRWLLGAVCLVIAGSILWTQGRAVAAGAALARGGAERAIQLAPRDAYYRAAAGGVAGQFGSFDDAARHYRAATELDPFRPSYHWRLGLAELSAQASPRQALAELRQAVELNPTSRTYPRALAQIEESVRQARPDLLPSVPPRK